MGQRVSTRSTSSPDNWNTVAPIGGWTDTTSRNIVAANATYRIVVCGMVVQNASATATEITVRDGPSGSIYARLMLPANMPPTNINFDPPFTGSINTPLTVVPATTAAAIYLNAQGFYVTA